MGRAKLLYGVETGVYRIQIDYGSAKKESELAKLTALVNKLDQRIAQAQQAVSTEEKKEEPLLLKVSAEIGIYETALQNLKPGEPVPKPTAYLKSLKELQAQQAKTRAAKSLLELIKKAKADNLKKVAYWQAFSPLEERNAWGLGSYVSTPPGSELATLEIPGDEQIVMLGFGPPNEFDGALTATEVMSPEQAYFNAAILPGWQRHRPYFRKGTITDINRSSNTCDVTLDAEYSKAQNLDANQLKNLFAVTFDYAPCQHEAFVVGDRVVVEFDGYDWESGKVIGFYGPIQYPCPQFGRIGIALTITWDQKSGDIDGKIWGDIKQWCRGASYIDAGDPASLLGWFVLAARCKLFEAKLVLQDPAYIESTTGVIEGHARQELSLGTFSWRFNYNDQSIPLEFTYIMPNSDDDATRLQIITFDNSTRLGIRKLAYGVEQVTYNTTEDLIDGVVVYGTPVTGFQFRKQSSDPNEQNFPSGSPGIYGVNAYLFADQDTTENTSVEELFGLPQLKVNLRGRRRLYEFAGVTRYTLSGDTGTLLRLEYSPAGWEDGNV